jgi:hypothetical protein
MPKSIMRFEYKSAIRPLFMQECTSWMGGGGGGGRGGGGSLVQKDFVVKKKRG